MSAMTATLEQTQCDLLKLVNLVQKGQDVVITSQGRPVARLTAARPSGPSPNRLAWLARLAELRAQLSTGKEGLTAEEILAEDRGE